MIEPPAGEETERVLKHLAKDLRSKAGSKNICIAGGVGLNSVSNKIILDECGFENIFPKNPAFFIILLFQSQAFNINTCSRSLLLHQFP